MNFESTIEFEGFDKVLLKALGLKPHYVKFSVLMDKRSDSKLPAVAGIGFDKEKETFIFYRNDEGFNKLSVAERVAVIEHEFLHVMLGHLTTRVSDYTDDEQKEEHVLLNIAMDAAINDFLPDLPNWTVSSKLIQKWVDEANLKICVEAKKEWEYYFLILKQIQQKTGGKGSFSGVQGIDKHDWDSMSEADRQKMEAEVKGALEKLKNSQQWGNIPGEIGLVIDKLLKSVIPWQKELRLFGQNCKSSEKSYTRMRTNRRNPGIWPGQRCEDKANVIVWVDSSGSVPDNLIKKFFNEVAGMAKFANVWIGVHDYNIKTVEKFKKASSYTVLGRGGTSFDECFRFVKDRSFRKQWGKFADGFSGIIMLTDGEAADPKIEDLKIKVLWVLPQNHSAPTKIGKEIFLNERN